jgi:site-specific DNA-methyltransferase (adenine-specific)
MSTVEVVHGDNLAFMAGLRAAGAQFDLAYFDPPFFTGRTFRMPDGELAYADVWSSLEEYLQHLRLRVAAALPLLVPGGSLVVHVDPKVSAYVCVQCGDHVFGRDAFAGEIIWRYRKWPSRARNFQRVHDVLLRWVKPGAPAVFEVLHEALAPSTIKTHGGRRQVHAWLGKRRTSVQYLPEQSPGTYLGDVWEVPILAPSGKERTGYPTQKPVALLRRLVRALSRPGRWVLDPYAGSGTTAAACLLEGRSCASVDSSASAVRVARARLERETCDAT